MPIGTGRLADEWSEEVTPLRSPRSTVSWGSQILEQIAPRRGPYPEDWTRPCFAPVDQLSGQAARSSFWTLSSAYLAKFLQLFVTAILARLLVPADFGLVGMAVIVVGLVRMFGNYGMGAAIIYRRDTSEVHLSTAYWFNLAVSVALAAAGIAGAPLAADYFGDPRVSGVLFVLSFTFVIEGAGSMPWTILTKSLRFGELAAINVGSALVSFAVSLSAVVLFEAGYWGLIAGMLAGSLSHTLLRFLAARWLPRWIFDRAAFRDLFRYGRNFFANGVLNYFSWNLGHLLVGRTLGPHGLGVYLFAHGTPDMVRTEFSQRIMGVLFPVLCAVADDPERFRRGYLSAVRFVSLVSFPACLGLFAVADHFILAVYGDQWVEAILPLRILCLAALSMSVLTSMGSVFNALGRPEIEVKWNLVLLPIMLGLVYLGSGHGLVGVAIAVSVAANLGFVAWWLALRLAGIRAVEMLRTLAPTLLASAVMAAAVHAADAWWLAERAPSPFVALPLLVALGAAIYAAIAFAFLRPTLLALWSFARGGLSLR